MKEATGEASNTVIVVVVLAVIAAAAAIIIPNLTKNVSNKSSGVASTVEKAKPIA